MDFLFAFAIEVVTEVIITLLSSLMLVLLNSVIAKFRKKK